MQRPHNPFAQDAMLHPEVREVANAFEEGVDAGIEFGKKVMMEWLEENNMAGLVVKAKEPIFSDDLLISHTQWEQLKKEEP